MTSVRKTGDWSLASRTLAEAPSKLKRAINTSLMQEAHFLRSLIVKGITAQAPGGKQFKALAQNTLITRKLKNFGGEKALMVRADLRNGISAIVRKGEACVGVPRKARGKDGKPLVDVAELNEYGSDPIVIPITPAMRRFLGLLHRESGTRNRETSGSGVVVTQIPPRPFLRPSFEKFSKGIEKRFLGRVASIMGMGGK